MRVWTTKELLAHHDRAWKRIRWQAKHDEELARRVRAMDAAERAYQEADARREAAVRADIPLPEQIALARASEPPWDAWHAAMDRVMERLVEIRQERERHGKMTPPR